MTEDTIVVFTARSPARVIREGGSGAWVLNPGRAKLCKWLVCTQNRHNPDHEFSDATEPHGAAFLIGKITAITKSTEDGNEDRWWIGIGDYSEISLSNFWDRGRNPVRYASLDELSLNPDEHSFNSSVNSSEVLDARKQGTPLCKSTCLTIEEARKGLAATFGVKSDAVEIVIRG